MDASPTVTDVATRPTVVSVDVVTLISVWALALFVLPSRLVVPVGGGIGSPAIALGVGAAFWWVLSRMHPESGIDRGVQPVRYALIGLVGFATLSYVVADLRVLDDLERGAGARTLIQLASVVGIALVVCDGITSRRRLKTLVDRVVFAGAIMATYGTVQFVAGWDPTLLFDAIPGLVRDASGGIGERSVFNRPAGPALHPIEFGVVVASLLPLALHRAFTRLEATGVSRWLPVLLIGAAVPLSLSRSALLSAAVGGLVLALVLPARERLKLMIGGAVGAASMVFVPGLVGTLRGLFTGVETDPSIQARLDRVPRIFELVEEAPLLGRGFGVYTVEGYFLLDSEFYTSLIEVGVIGLGVYAAVLAVAVWSADVPRRVGAGQLDRQLGGAIIASLLALVVSVFTFDAFFYRILTGMIGLTIGLAGAVARLAREPDRDDPSRALIAV